MAKQVLTISDISPSGNLKKGVIQLPITEARIIASNDIGVKGATDGGTAAKDTDPILERSNGATDKSLRLSWAAASVIEIQMPPVAYPPDLDDAQPIVVNILAAMKAGSADAPVITVSAWEGVGDTNMGGDTAALSTALQKLSVALAGTDVGAWPSACQPRCFKPFVTFTTRATARLKRFSFTTRTRPARGSRPIPPAS